MRSSTGTANFTRFVSPFKILYVSAASLWITPSPIVAVSRLSTAIKSSASGRAVVRGCQRAMMCGVAARFARMRVCPCGESDFSITGRGTSSTAWSGSETVRSKVEMPVVGQSKSKLRPSGDVRTAVDNSSSTLYVPSSGTSSA